MKLPKTTPRAASKKAHYFFKTLDDYTEWSRWAVESLVAFQKEMAHNHHVLSGDLKEYLPKAVEITRSIEGLHKEIDKTHRAVIVLRQRLRKAGHGLPFDNRS